MKALEYDLETFNYGFEDVAGKISQEMETWFIHVTLQHSLKALLLPALMRSEAGLDVQYTQERHRISKLLVNAKPYPFDHVKILRARKETGMTPSDNDYWLFLQLAGQLLRWLDQQNAVSKI